MKKTINQLKNSEQFILKSGHYLESFACDKSGPDYLSEEETLYLFGNHLVILDNCNGGRILWQGTVSKATRKIAIFSKIAENLGEKVIYYKPLQRRLYLLNKNKSTTEIDNYGCEIEVEKISRSIFYLIRNYFFDGSFAYSFKG